MRLRRRHGLIALTMVLGYPPGGTIDVIARKLSSELSTVLRVPILIDNRAGANDSVAAN